MLVAFISAFAAFIVAVLALLHRERSHARDLIRLAERGDRLREKRENELWARLAHAHDKPWDEAPVDEAPPPVADDELDDDEFMYEPAYIDDHVVAAGF